MHADLLRYDLSEALTARHPRRVTARRLSRFLTAAAASLLATVLVTSLTRLVVFSIRTQDHNQDDWFRHAMPVALAALASAGLCATLAGFVRAELVGWLLATVFVLAACMLAPDQIVSETWERVCWSVAGLLWFGGLPCSLAAEPATPVMPVL